MIHQYFIVKKQGFQDSPSQQGMKHSDWNRWQTAFNRTASTRDQPGSCAIP